MTTARSGVAWSLLVVAFAMPSLHGCRLHKQRGYVSDGLLMSGLNRQAFLDEWGSPTRTSTVTGDEILSGRFGPFGGTIAHGKATYDVWEYESRETKLIFNGAALVSWITSKTVDELRAKN